MKKRKKKRVGMKYLEKRKYCVGTEPVHWSSTTTGRGGSVVSALVSQAKGKTSCGYFFVANSFFPFSNLCWTIHQFGRILTPT